MKMVESSQWATITAAALQSELSCKAARKKLLLRQRLIKDPVDFAKKKTKTQNTTNTSTLSLTINIL